MNKVSKVLLTILIFNLTLIANVFASDDANLTVNEVIKNAEILNSEEYEYVEIDDVTYINPLYKDVVEEEDLNKPSDIMMLSTSVDCENIEEAGLELRNELKERNEMIEVSYITNVELDSSIFTQVADEAMKHTGVPTEGDYILWQYAGWNASAKGYKNNYSGKYYYTLTFTFTYNTTYEQEKEMNVAVSNLLNTLNLQGTDYEKITTIYDYMCNNITYDYTSTGTLKHTAYAALINKTAVCQGYAVLFYRLALENNIDARLISGLGNGGAHGWNIVKIENYYYNLDSTWDTNYAKSGYRYYMLTDDNFSRHVRDDEYSTDEFYLMYPMGTQNYTSEMNEIDKNKPKLNGLILDEQTGYYSYYENGNINTKFTGLYEQANEKWYVISGKVDFKFNGVYTDTSGTTYIIENNRVRTDLTTVMKIDGIWRMVINGVVNYTYTGIGTNENGTWYLENGKVTFTYTGTYIEGEKAYIVEGSKVYAIVTTSTTSVIKINNVWRMVINGVVNYNYTGIGTNENGTWLLQNGKVTFNYTGNYTDANGATYIIENSQVRTDIIKVMKIANVWRMVINGVVDYSYTGIGTNENGIWYIHEGKVTFKSKGTYTEGEKAYIVEGSKVYAIVTTSTTKVIKINNVWRMIINGEVDYNYTGIGTNENGTWYVKNGTIDFTYTGTCDDGIKTYIVEKNEVMTKYTKVMKVDGIWRMVINGIVNYSYTGVGTNENGTWYIEGAVKFNYTGTYFEGERAYIIEDGKVIVTVTPNTTKVIKINNVWRMVINGFVNYNYTGIGTNENGTWLVEKGMVTFNYTGNYVDANGKTYKVQNSKIIN